MNANNIDFEGLNKQANSIEDEPTRQFAIALISELEEVRSSLKAARRDRAELRRRLEIALGAIGCGGISGAFKLASALSDNFLIDNTPFIPQDFKIVMNSASGVFFALAVGIFIGKPGEILARLLNLPLSAPHSGSTPYSEND